MKGISPMIMIVLLIAFGIAIGGIILTWFSALTSTQTASVGVSSESGAKCGGVALTISEVRFACLPITNASTTPNVFINITVTHSAGIESISNLSFEVTGGGITNSTNYTITLAPGQSLSTSVVTNRSIRLTSPGPSCPPSLVRVRALCDNRIPIVANCKLGDRCFQEY